MKTHAIHQRGCRPRKCGGDFTCEGCERLVGWCFGCDDVLGEEHCDDCWRDRLAVLERCKQGLGTRYLIGSDLKKDVWRRAPVKVAEELCSDGFLEFKRNGRFVLTERAREALS